ncbi:hypothetical protein [Halomicrobium salinisoli]|uniref:hypothetical protein n=1 Tax=Halomicrobium salinisoli TaxID=2878391 RepID=UPI001CF04B73|nr:hypothetical protein [Halomicrobium salinisoli]
MAQLLVDLTIVGFISIVVLLVLFRAFFKFYSKLEIYHRTVEDHDPIIAVKGYDGSPDNLHDMPTSRHDLKQQPANDPFVKYGDVENNDSPPEIIIDLEENEKRCYGENRVMKFFRLWGYSSATILVATGILMVYLALFQQLSVDFTLPGVDWIIGVVVILSILHFVIRVGSFLPLGMPDDEDGRNRLRKDLHNFMFSFIMSTAALATISVFVHLITGGSLSGTLPYDLNGAMIIASIIVVPGILSALSEVLLQIIPVPEGLKRDKIRQKEPIQTGDG